MKANLKECALATLIVSLFCVSAPAQGTFVYDQQSSTESNLGEGIAAIQTSQPVGQSFTPAFSSIGFIRLYLSDGAFNGVGATVAINLRTDSIIGPVLASTDPISMPDRFASTANFFFPTPVSLVPGTTYYFQPVLQTGDNTFGVGGHNAFNYAGGTAFFFGQPSQATDLWFREGIIPEPSSSLLVLAGFGLLVCGSLVKLLRKRSGGLTRTGSSRPLPSCIEPSDFGIIPAHTDLLRDRFQPMVAHDVAEPTCDFDRRAN